MFKNLVYPLLAAVLATMANAEGCYNGGNKNASPCDQWFGNDFCENVVYGTRSECHILDSGTRCDFAVTGPTGRNPLYSDCLYAMTQLAYFCDTGGLKTWQGYQYKLDPNDGGSC